MLRIIENERKGTNRALSWTKSEPSSLRTFDQHHQNQAQEYCTSDPI